MITFFIPSVYAQNDYLISIRVYHFHNFIITKNIIWGGDLCKTFEKTSRKPSFLSGLQFSLRDVEKFTQKRPLKNVDQKSPRAKAREKYAVISGLNFGKS